MDLSTTYLGLKLPHPLMPGASPMVHDMDRVRRLEDAGAAAIVMDSLFEEQIIREEMAVNASVDLHANAFAEATSYFPSPPDFELGPDEYLENVRRIKSMVRIPVIASLNGTTPGGWVRYARLIEQAGADALELNVYTVATNPDESAAQLENQTLELVRQVRLAVKFPIAVKLSPFYTCLPHFARRLVNAGANGLVLFNRFYQPDIDVEKLEVFRVNLSDSSELLPRLRWLALLSGRLDASLAATGGVHTTLDAVKAVMAGADAVQMVSALLRHHPEYLCTVREGISDWLEEHQYESLAQLRGSMSLLRCPDPKAYERVNYMQTLLSWRE